ncbi:hypothetical protein NKJ06_28920, partial [Mesorhizobium sp. M0293]|uniref:hypothetical protein n=1 Tax=Mesorhizobium sp. M0293 TaxID=2956930 RepID=UPI00333CB7FB
PAGSGALISPAHAGERGDQAVSYTTPWDMIPLTMTSPAFPRIVLRPNLGRYWRSQILSMRCLYLVQLSPYADRTLPKLVEPWDFQFWPA